MNFTSYNDIAVAAAVDLVNTFNPVRRREHLNGPAALSAFLRTHGDSYAGAVTERDVAAVRAVRKRLRAAFSAPTPQKAAAVLNALLEESGAVPHLTDHDGEPWHLHFTPGGAPLADRMAAEAAAALAVVIAEGGFERLRVCDGDRCEDVFVDSSKNRSRRFCSPEVCGNRASVAAYRRRQREKH